MDDAADMEINVKKLYTQARGRVVRLRTAELSKLQKNIDTITVEDRLKDLKVQTMPGLVEKHTKLRTAVAQLWAALAKFKVNVAVMSGERSCSSSVSGRGEISRSAG